MFDIKHYLKELIEKRVRAAFYETAFVNIGLPKDWGIVHGGDYELAEIATHMQSAQATFQMLKVEVEDLKTKIVDLKKELEDKKWVAINNT